MNPNLRKLDRALSVLKKMETFLNDRDLVSKTSTTTRCDDSTDILFEHTFVSLPTLSLILSFSYTLNADGTMSQIWSHVSFTLKENPAEPQEVQLIFSADEDNFSFTEELGGERAGDALREKMYRGISHRNRDEPFVPISEDDAFHRLGTIAALTKRQLKKLESAA